MRYVLAAAFALAFTGTALADGQPVDHKTESEPIQLSVADTNAIVDADNFIIHVGDAGICSGTLLEPVKYRLLQTAHHCISFAISTVEKEVNEDGEVKKKQVEVYQDVKVEQKIYADGKQVGGSTYVATIVAYDKIHDLGLLQIKAEKIPQEHGVQVFDKRFGTLDRGDAVWAMGNPLGLDASVSFGHIASVNRGFKLENGDDVAYFQTDAGMLTFGNSGGALLKGKYLIGIPDLTASGTPVSFSVPYTFVQDLLTKNCYEDVWNDKPKQTHEECEAEKKAKADDKTTTKDLLKQFLKSQEKK